MFCSSISLRFHLFLNRNSQNLPQKEHLCKQFRLLLRVGRWFRPVEYQKSIYMPHYQQQQQGDHSGSSIVRLSGLKQYRFLMKLHLVDRLPYQKEKTSTNKYFLEQMFRKGRSRQKGNR